MPGLKVFVTSFLRCDRAVLLLRRRDDAAFAPGFWTGVGGKAHGDELGDLTVAALREIREEAGIRSEQIRDFRLEVVLTQPEDGDIAVLAFFSGQIEKVEVSACDEGALRWADFADLDALPMIENARRALREILSASADRGVAFGVCNPGPPDDLRDFIIYPRRWRLD